MKQTSYALLFITTVIIILSSSFVVYANEAMINVNNLNVRSGPGTSFDTITQVNQGETFEITDNQDEWIEIKIDQTTGWITKEFVTIREESTIESDTSKIWILYDGTNIRDQASTDGKIVSQINKGEVLQTKSEVNNWVEIEWDGKQGYIPSWLVESSKQPSRINTEYGVKNKTIVIDAGHGGRDVGAIGASGRYEKDYTITTAYNLKRKLELLGANVILTRTNDNYLSLGGRSSLSNLVDADIFLSIHYNSLPQHPDINGANTYYYYERDAILATTIQKELITSTAMEDNGTEFGDFQVIRMNRRPSILLELGFLSNNMEEQNIMSSTFQEDITKGIISGLNKFYSNN
ncbi:N-acetylmuramoyl-L-alanine amidase [Aquibacillus rhizosphaerae]|uniref:N-acetylmuramoyl-L-alanine amidase n=1 Tax=Aquibacillus rhizosphaerae TaxID=3051431 RepID=A0ABT7L6G1_9BACI|nr:N-acetylmuramoyl-L-alanine amidase [Aquibacillus sp. LR5S19]MDL4841438.1 N-acetylmuramoyl-L-alanine amidase [Aquibacillus sp. LR5S19]